MKKTIATGLFYFILTLSYVYGQSIDNKSYNVLPWPEKITSEQGKFVIGPDFSVTLQNGVSERVYEATRRFIRRLSDRTGVFFEKGFPQTNNKVASLEVFYQRPGDLKLNEDESYALEVSDRVIKLKAATDIGILRGLETLLQLITADSVSFYFPLVKIEDQPRFPWRGLMIDVARHYQPIHVLKRNLDAMAAVKLNVFHWHLTDDQGFRVESKTHPKLHQLGSDGQYYTHKEIKEVVKFAGDRGIRVIPEFDVPGHATAILTAYPEIGSKKTEYQIERNAGIFDPTLDPTNERTYDILKDLFGEMAELFPDEYFHIGGDENMGKHWDQNERITAFKQKHDFTTNHELQTYFNIRIEKILKQMGKKIVGWEEIMTKDMPKTAVIHSWRGVNEGVAPGQSLADAAKKGYQTMLSNGYYIDLMLDVEEHYLVDPMPEAFSLTKEERSRILGGEATMWGELVTPLTIDSRIWPRTAAIAERFWSPKNVRNINHLKKRLAIISFRLEELGLTHIKNRDVILRNIANGRNIKPLIKLSKVCQPLKIYTRNKGGTEYKSFSPFTLFADACTTDAVDAVKFKSLVEDYTVNPKTNRRSLEQFLNLWIENDQDLLLLKSNTPLINEISDLSSNLKNLAVFISKIIRKEEITKLEQEEFLKLLNLAKEPKADVELVVIDTFLQLFNYLKKKEI